MTFCHSTTEISTLNSNLNLNINTKFKSTICSPMWTYESNDYCNINCINMHLFYFIFMNSISYTNIVLVIMDILYSIIIKIKFIYLWITIDIKNTISFVLLYVIKSLSLFIFMLSIAFLSHASSNIICIQIFMLITVHKSTNIKNQRQKHWILLCSMRKTSKTEAETLFWTWYIAKQMEFRADFTFQKFRADFTFQKYI